MKKTIKIFSLVFFSLLFFTSTSTLLANTQIETVEDATLKTSTVKRSNEDWDSRRSFLEKNMVKLGSKNPVEAENWLSNQGVQKCISIKDATSISKKSSRENIHLNNIGGYYDSVSHRYLIEGYWNWDDISNINRSVGAFEGISLAMCQPNCDVVTGYILSSYPAGIAVYDQYGNNYGACGGAARFDKFGVLFTFQDKWNSGAYVGFKGSVWLWLDYVPKQLPIYIKMDYEHTWTNSNLQSIGFICLPGSTPSINMSWSKVPRNFVNSNKVRLDSWTNY